MATISPGKYYIVSALSIKSDNKEVQDSGNLALHLYWGWTGNGTSVNLKFLDYKDYELWEVSSLGEDIIRITSCLAGRSLDIDGAKLVNGTNVQIWDANASNAQKWTAVSSGGTVTVDNVSYPTYYIKPQANQNLCLDVQDASTESSANVQIWDCHNQDNQKWAFIPWRLFHDEGIYEIRSMLNTNLCIDVPFGTKNAETQLQIYTCNHGDNQKWIFKDMYKPDNSDTGWRITNVATGLVIDAYNKNGSLRDGTVVQQFPDNGGTNQRWLLNDHGSTVIDGYDCKMVSFGVQNNNNLVIDVPAGNAITGNALELWTSFGTDNQLWGLYPTKKSADQLVVPNNCGFSKILGGDAMSCIPWDGTNGEAQIYPRWSCPSSWLSGQNHFQIRYAIRRKSSVDGWGSYSTFTDWKDITVYTDNGVAWMTDGIDASFDYQGKSEQYPFVATSVKYEVRCVMQSSEELLYGQAGNAEVLVPFAPTFKLLNFTIYPESIQIHLTSNIKYGLSYFYLKQAYLVKDGKQTPMVRPNSELATNWSIEPYIVNGVGVITYDRNWFTNLSIDGTIKILYSVGTSDKVHMYGLIDQKWTGEVTPGLGAGDYRPTITLDSSLEDERSVVASIDKLGTQRMWIVSNTDNIKYELQPIATNGQVSNSFAVPYPFGQDFRLEGLTYNNNVTKWGMEWLNVSKDNKLITGRPCHAWSTIDSDGRVGRCILILELKMSESPSTSGSISLDYDSHSISGREYQTVSFSNVVKKTFSAEGVLLKKYPTITSSDDLFNTVHFTPTAMAQQLKHCLYRAPNGEICTVAVTGITYESKPDDVTLVTGEVVHGYTTYSVSMVRESF